jgi:hypothetical protein
MGPIPEREFVRLIRSHGCNIVMNGNHGSIYRDGNFLTGFAVSHKHGGKREVKPVYVRQFLKAIREG